MGDEMAHTPGQGKLQQILDRPDPQGGRGEKRLRTLLVIPRLHDAVALLSLLVHDRLRLILIGTQQIDIEESLFQRVVQLRPIVHVIMQIGIASLDLDGVNRLFYRTQLAQRGGIAANTSLQTKTLLTGQVIEEREAGIEVVFGLRQTIPLIIGDTQQREPHGVIYLVQFALQLTVCRAAHLRQVGLIGVSIAIGVIGKRMRMVQACTETQPVSECLLIDRLADQRILPALHLIVDVRQQQIASLLLIGASAIRTDIGTHHIEHQELILWQGALVVEIQSGRMRALRGQVGHIDIIGRVGTVAQDASIVIVRNAIAPVTQGGIEELLLRLLVVVGQVCVVHVHLHMAGHALLDTIHRLPIGQLEMFPVIPIGAIEVTGTKTIAGIPFRPFMVHLGLNVVLAPHPIDTLAGV